MADGIRFFSMMGKIKTSYRTVMAAHTDVKESKKALFYQMPVSFI